MRSFLLFLSFFIGSSISVFALTIEQAIKEGKLAIAFENKGAFSGPGTECTFQNLSTATLDISSPAGLLIQSEDSTSQKLVIAEPIMASLGPRKILKRLLSTFCINSHKAAPASKEKYTLYSHADVWLLRTIKFIASNKVPISEAQQAVWACVDGKKELYAGYNPSSSWPSLKKLIIDLYQERVGKGLILPDTSRPVKSWHSYVLQGNYEWFVTEPAMYAAYLEDSAGQRQTTLMAEVKREKSVLPLRYLYPYAFEREKTFYLALYRNGQLIERVKAAKDVQPRIYERYFLRSQTVFDVKATISGNLDICDSAGHVYISLFNSRKMNRGVVPINFSFSLVKPQDKKLYLVLKDGSGKALETQELGETHLLKPLNGMVYARLAKPADAIFGLYDEAGTLLKEFETRRYTKGLQMLAYSFIFKKNSDKDVYVKLIDKLTGAELYSEKVFVK